MVRQTVPPRSDAVQVAGLLNSPEITQLVAELEATRWTGRPGYPVSAMVGMALTKNVYTLPTWTRTVALVREHAALRMALGCPDVASVPSVHACYRFTRKLRKFKPLLDACLDRVIAALHEQIPELGTTVAIDASDLPAYANGQRYLYKGGPERKQYSDPDASWGHRSAVSTRSAGSFYGYKLHQVVCVETTLPLAWRVETAKASESTFALPLLDAVKARGSRPQVAIMDMGYDMGPVYDGCEERDCHPVIPLRETLRGTETMIDPVSGAFVGSGLSERRLGPCSSPSSTCSCAGWSPSWEAPRMLGTTMSRSSSFATSSQSSGARSAGPASAAGTGSTWLR